MHFVTLITRNELEAEAEAKAMSEKDNRRMNGRKEGEVKQICRSRMHFTFLIRIRSDEIIMHIILIQYHGEIGEIVE